jgi:hypothetical protein
MHHHASCRAQGTSIVESHEHGRQYIDLARKFVEQFRRGVFPLAGKGPYRSARSVEISLGKVNREHGLRQIEHPDGLTSPGVVATTGVLVEDLSFGRQGAKVRGPCQNLVRDCERQKSLG